MRTNDRHGNRRTNRGRGQRRNAKARDEYSAMTSRARENPLVTAAAVGGAVAAGLFLWSRRNQISDQISNLSDQIGEWRDSLGSNAGLSDQSGMSVTSFVGSSGSRVRCSRRTQAEIAEEALTLKETGETAYRPPVDTGTSLKG